MATTLTTVAGNTAPPLLITCTRAKTVIDLTSVSTVTIKIKGPNTIGITQLAGPCAIQSPATAGVVSYAPLTTDFPIKGSYKGDIKLTYSDATFEILYNQLLMKARAAL